MRWIEPDPRVVVPLAVEFSLLRAGLARAPDNPALLVKLGAVLALRGDLSGALKAYAAAARADLGAFRVWSELATIQLRLDDPTAALAVCARAEDRGHAADIHYVRGCALRSLGRGPEARRAFLLALEQGSNRLDALHKLLRPLAMAKDGGPLLAFCDVLAPTLRDTALARGHRALAFSRLGRTAEALHLVDLERHVARLAFVPPAEFGDAARFNRALADEILADPVQQSPARDGLEIDFSAQYYRSPAFTALRVFMRGAMDGYLAQLHERGLDTVLPPPPAQAILSGASVVLRGDGRNGEHIHGTGYLSSVYHVAIPASVAQASDNRGALVLGPCSDYTGGYTACWGTRHIKPVAGWLTIFPSHVFHDVVPSGTDEPRISIAADLRPDA